MTRTLLLLAAVAMLASCAMLTAETPLFGPADQDGRFALAEGLWVAKGEDCKVNPAHSGPTRKSCLDWVRVARAQDGSWLVTAPDGARDDDMRVVFVAAAPASGRAPLYVAETVNSKTGEINYGAVTPRSVEDGPVTRLAASGVSCSDASGDWGEIAGITLTREDGKVVRCIATTKEAVREATRRAAIDALPTIGTNELKFVRP